MEKKKPDVKMIVGCTILLVVFAVVAVFFWTTVGKEAQKVKEEEAKAEETAISAIYLEYGDLLKESLFVDMDTHTIFTADIPEEGIYNQKGKLISGDVLEHGDMVKIYGNGAMGMSLPGVYPGVTKMQRLGRAALEETQEYMDIVKGTLKGTDE